MASMWRREDMPLLEFLRKTNRQGTLARHIRQRHKVEAMEGESLEAFANRCACRGEKMIAAVTSSRFSGKFFSEWVVLNMPFRSFADLLFENLALVPENYQGMAMALHHASHFWRDEAAVKAELELHAMRDTFVQSNMAMIAAHTEVVDLYISGRLVLGVHEIPTRAIQNRGGSLPSQLHEEQWRVVDTIADSVRKSVEEAWVEEPPSNSFKTVAHAVLGPAGSGKSTAVQVAVHQAVDQGARVVIACPTRMLVADLRQKFPDLDVDSIHAVFEIWKPEQYTLDS
eukprot:6455815-Amphidinium_carterae.1